jgi:lipopolysaccharide transport system permease protein
MVILTVVFSLLLRTSVPNYPTFVLIALMIWRFFQVATAQSLYSIVGNPSLVSRVYLPRTLIVLSSNLANLFGSSIEFMVLLPLLFLLGVHPDIHVLFLPAIILMEFLLVFSVSLLLASLNLKYRDVSQIWEIAVQLGFFLSPIVYDESAIPLRYKFLYSLNPITRLIEATRGIFIQQQFPALSDLFMFLSVTGLILLVGLTVFQHLQTTFAEEL